MAASEGVGLLTGHNETAPCSWPGWQVVRAKPLRHPPMGMGSREVNPSAFRDGRLQLVLMPGPLVGTLNLNRQPG